MKRLIELLVYTAGFIIGFFLLSVVSCTRADAQVPFPSQADPEPRDTGNKAAMHVYWFNPTTLEITHVETYLFKDDDACKDAVVKAAMIALPHASEGDIVNVQCVAMRPPKKASGPKPGSTDL